MFSAVFKFELKYWLKNWSFYLYWLVLFGLAFVYTVGSAGLFDGHLVQGTKTIRLVNSSFEINYVMGYFNKLFLFLLPAIVGATLYKDYKDKSHSILYSFPIFKADYLSGKILSGLLMVIGLTLSVPMAMMMAEHVPGLDPLKLGAFNPWAHTINYLMYTLPNILIVGALVFSVVLWLRNVYAAFGIVILLFMLQSITQNALDGNGFMIALLDPLAENTAGFMTQFWTLAEKNSLEMPVQTVLIYNRLLWLTVAGLVYFFAYRSFTFSQEGWSFSIRRPNKLRSYVSTSRQVKLSYVTYSHTFLDQCIHAWRASSFHVGYIIRNWSFGLVVAFGILTVVFILARVTNGSDLVLLPITRVMLMAPALFFNGVVTLATFIYSGILIHRERLANMFQLSDSTPVSDWVTILSKVFAVIRFQVLLLLILLVSGIIIQSYNGYTDFNFGLYVFHLFGVMLVPLMTWTLAAFFIHTSFPNFYMGLFILLIGWIGITSIDQLGIETILLKFNHTPFLNVTDMNGYGHGLIAYYLVVGYWFVFGLFLLVLTRLFWIRGTQVPLKERLRLVRLRWQLKDQLLLLVLILTSLPLGWKIYTEENKSSVLSQKEQDIVFKAFERRFKKFKDIPPPKIQKADLQLDIFPEHQSFQLTGQYTLVNTSSENIDTILVKTGFDEITSFSMDASSISVDEDDIMQFSVLRFQEPMKPGDSIKFDFTVKSRPNTLFDRASAVLPNGTFLGPDILPRFGYSFEKNASEPDSLPVMTNYMSADADYVHLKTQISTSKDQMATAPGSLIKEWTVDNRRYFIYQTKAPIKFSFAFNSAEYETQSDQWKNVALEILHHKGHHENLHKFLNGTKAALGYNSKQMGLFQHDQMRLIEFPESEGTFATTMGNIMPISERRFIANTNDAEGKIDESFYVAAHEMTHHWWGAQVVPADRRGALMLTESVTEYISLRIYENEYGKESARKFLNLQRMRYLKGRTNENKDESTLMYVLPEQQYIAYGKGALAFHALHQSIGEVRLNQILQDFLLEHRQQNPPYPTSIQLVNALKSGVPDSLNYLVEDWFETITFYDNKLQDVSVHMIGEDRYQIDVSVVSKKVRDGVDNTPFERNQQIQISIQNENGEVIERRTVPMDLDQPISILTNQLPAILTLDPNWIYLDKDIEDNVHRF